MAVITKKNYRQAEKAFMLFSGCNKNEFETKPDWSDGPLLAKSGQHVYRIDTARDILNDCREMLESPGEASLIPVQVWSKVAGTTHSHPNFFPNFFSELDQEEYHATSLALSASLLAADPANAFWFCLQRLDETGRGQVYGKAVWAATRVADIDAIADLLVKAYILNGHQHLNQVEGGHFESVSVDNEEYFIYTIDPSRWDD